MNIVLINQNWFAADLKELGHRVLSFGRSEELDIRQEKFLLPWSDIKKALPNDFVPDLLIVHDDSNPVLITELESIDIPSVFYSVDTHHHFTFHSYLGLVFSHLFVAQKDYISSFESVAVNPYWLPLWASAYMQPQEPKTIGAIFLGTLNPKLNPDRVRFFDELKKLVPVDVRTAAFLNIFPQSEIIINQTVKGDLNFRVFEAMMSGALLITEKTGNGLSELFQDGEHLILYEKGNARDAADKISYFLEHKEAASRIGMAGRERICKEHLSKHRTLNLLEKLSTPTRPTALMRPFAAVANYSALSYNLKQQGEELWCLRAGLEVLRLTQLGLQIGDKPDPRLSIDIMRTLLALQPTIGEKAAQALLDDLRQSFPEITVFHLVKIDQLASNGNVALAQAIASGLSELPPDDVIQQAGSVVMELRQ